MIFRSLDISSSNDVAALTICLLQEIIERTGTNHFTADVPATEKLCHQLMESGHYHVMAALEGDQIVAFATLCESFALYAEGAFGIVQELYVLPNHRSAKVGEKLLDAVAEHAKTQGWKRLELCTPPVPEFDRTVSFYQNNRFEISGGYKMKRLIPE